jgi:hypothetical protein
MIQMIQITIQTRNLRKPGSGQPRRYQDAVEVTVCWMTEDHDCNEIYVRLKGKGSKWYRVLRCSGRLLSVG